MGLKFSVTVEVTVSKICKGVAVTTESENGIIVAIVVLAERTKLPACADTDPVADPVVLLAAGVYVKVAVPLGPTVCEIGVVLLSVTPVGNVPLPLGPWPVTVTDVVNPLAEVMVATILDGSALMRFSVVGLTPSEKGATVV
jgi:hypothetical protein